MSAGHNHGPQGASEKSLLVVLGLTSTFMIAEVVGGVIFRSLALISDAAHMLTDAAALAVAVVAIRIGKRPADHKRTFGYFRFEILAAAFNAVVLFLVAAYILYEAYRRLRTPPEVQTLGMLAIASIGLVVNFVGMRILRAGSKSSLNIKGAYLEVWADMLGSVGVIIAAALIFFTGWVWLDSLVAAAIGVWVLPRTWRLLKEALNILLEGVPPTLALDDIEKALLAVPGVGEIHDLHVWSLTSGKHSLTVHVVRVEGAIDESILRQIQNILAVRFSIRHVTVQIERVACDLANYHGGSHFPDHSHDHGQR